MNKLEKRSVIKYHEQLPPQHNLAEEILLGSILLHSQIITITVQEIAIDYFATEIHQLLYGTILNIYLSNEYVDSVILINTLWELNLLVKIGGINKVLNLLRQAQIFASGTIPDKTIYYYIDLIRDKYIRRLLIQYAYDIVDLAHISSIKFPTIFFKTERYLSKIKLLISDKENDNASSLIAKVLLNLKVDSEKKENISKKSGFNSLDRLTNGFTDGDLIVIAGRPSMGKTSLSLNIAFNILAREQYGVSIFSLEMSKEQIVYKLLAIASSIPVNQIRSGKISKIEWTELQDAGHTFANSNIEINDIANLSVRKIEVKVRTSCDGNPNMSLIIIDYLQLLRLEHLSLSNRTEELSLITRSLKILAKDLNIPIIVLSQLNRNVETRINKKPLLADLRESGCLATNTSIVINAYRTICAIAQVKNYFIDEKINRVRSIRAVHGKIQHHSKKKIVQGNCQYIYNVSSSHNVLVRLTHNHDILCSQKWKKSEQLKYFELFTYIDMRSDLLVTELQKLKKIKLIYRHASQDIVMYEEKHFLANDGLVLHNSIEQDADLVLLLYREAYYNQNINNQNLTDVIVAKHRNGLTGTAHLYFHPDTSSFENV